MILSLSALARHSQNTRINKKPITSGSSFTTTTMSSSTNPFRSAPPSTTATTTQNEAQNRIYTNDDLDMEEPPPYTLTPAVHAGEATLEQGPARPFQPAPAPTRPAQQNNPSPPAPAPAPSTSQGRLGSGGSLLQQLSSSLNIVVRELTGPSPPPQQRSYQWSSYPGQSQSQSQSQSQTYRPPPGPPSSSYASTSSNRLPPPPRHPSSSLPPPSSLPAPAQPSSPTSDFARDFYAAGPADPSTQEYLPPLPPSPAAVHPPRTLSLSGSSARGHQRSVSNPGPSRTGASDGKPTTTPTPGHPLLRDGKLLVYPKGWECHKCHNTGYKSYDPSRPCKKCWSKYGKPFSGPLAFSFGSPVVDGANTTNFQRPLPQFAAPRPPPPPPRETSFFAPPPGSSSPYSHQAPRSPSNSNSNNPQGGFFSGLGPPTGAGMGMGMGMRSNPILTQHPPPPNAIVYTAGDPRIGGRLCWRCDGKGNVSILPGFGFLTGGEREMCTVCNGIGRTFD